MDGCGEPDAYRLLYTRTHPLLDISLFGTHHRSPFCSLIIPSMGSALHWEFPSPAFYYRPLQLWLNIFWRNVFWLEFPLAKKALVKKALAKTALVKTALAKRFLAGVSSGEICHWRRRLWRNVTLWEKPLVKPGTTGNIIHSDNFRFLPDWHRGTRKSACYRCPQELL